MFADHCFFDETPLELRVRFAARGPTETGTATACTEKQLAKTFMSEFAWSMLLRLSQPGPARAHESEHIAPAGFLVDTAAEDPRYLLIRGTCSPLVHAAANTTGETIARSLQKGNPSDVTKVFPVHLRLTEADQNGSNGRAQQIIKQSRESLWAYLPLLCLAHKTHAICEKVWHLQQPTLSGLIHAAKFFGGGGVMAKFRGGLDAYVRAHLQILRSEQPLHNDSVVAYRPRMTDHTTCTPASSKSRCELCLTDAQRRLEQDDAPALVPCGVLSKR